MVRGRRRRLPGAHAAARWVAADARDVACVRGSSAGPAVAVQADASVASVAGGLKRWQSRLERRRLLAVGRRGALVGAGSACLVQLGALASGSAGAGPWLLPAVVLASAAVAIGLAHRTSPAAAARLLDRDLELGAGVSTALELETSLERAAAGRGLGALVVQDVRGALGRSLAGARAGLQPRHREAALLAALVAALVPLLLVSSPRSRAASVAAAAPQGALENRALRAESGIAGSDSAGAGASLQGSAQAPVDAPPLAAVQTDGTTRTGGATSGRSPYGGGLANDAQAGGVKATSQATTQGGAVAPTDPNDGTSSQAGEREGSGASDASGGQPDGSGRGQSEGSTGGGKGKSAGAKPNGAKGTESLPETRDVARNQGGPPHKAGATAAPGKAEPGDISAKSGIGASAPGAASGRPPGKSGPGGASAGTTPGGTSAGHGVVPQLRAGANLPLSPTYKAVPGESGARAGSTSPNAGGGGGAGRSGQAKGGGASSGGGAGVAWVPPGAGTVASSDRGIVRGYFGSLDRVNSSGW